MINPLQESPWKLENQFFKYFQEKQREKDTAVFINQDLLLSFLLFSILQNLKLFDKVLKSHARRDTIGFWRDISSRSGMSGVLLATHTTLAPRLCG